MGNTSAMVITRFVKQFIINEQTWSHLFFMFLSSPTFYKTFTGRSQNQITFLSIPELRESCGGFCGLPAPPKRLVLPMGISCCFLFSLPLSGCKQKAIPGSQPTSLEVAGVYNYSLSLDPHNIPVRKMKLKESDRTRTHNKFHTWKGTVFKVPSSSKANTLTHFFLDVNSYRNFSLI